MADAGDAIGQWRAAATTFAHFEKYVGDPTAATEVQGSSPAADSEYRDNSVDSVILACVINGFLLAVGLAAFEALLRSPALRGTLAPRLRAPLARPLGWLRLAWQESGRPCLEPDSAAMIRFCQLGLRFSACGSLVALVMMPLYASGHGGAQGFNKFSLSNLSHRSDRFWGVVVSAYVLTAMFARLVVIEWHHFLETRREHFKRSAGGACGRDAAQAHHSLIVELLPPQARSEQAVRAFFEGVFGEDCVHSCVLQGDTRAEYLSIEHNATMRRQNSHGGLRELQAPMLPGQEDDGQQRADRQPPDGQSPNMAQAARDAAQAALDAAQQLHETTAGAALGMAQSLQDAAAGATSALQMAIVSRSATSTAFVTLRSAARCVEAQQVVLSHNGYWQVRRAPEPRDIIWRNVSTHLGQIKLRTTVAKALVAVGLLFWSVPITMIQAWSNLDGLPRKWFPQIGEFQDWAPLSYSFLTQYLPVLALIGLQSLLPVVFQAMAVYYEGYKTKSEVQRVVLNRCYGYELASLYVTVTSGVVWESLGRILDHPTEVLTILRSTLPNVAVYFVTFVLARAGGGLPLLLLRPWPLIRSCRRRRSVRVAEGEGCAAAAASSDALPRVHCDFGSEAANAALVLTIGLTYSFIAPAILPACAVYFGIATLVYRWLFAHVYEPEFDGEGAFWYDLFNSVLLGLLLGTLSLLALAKLYGSNLQAALLLPLPVSVVWLGYRCWTQMGAVSKWVPLEEAVKVDVDAGSVVELSPDLYLDPLLKQEEYMVDAAAEGGASERPAVERPADVRPVGAVGSEQ